MNIKDLKGIKSLIQLMGESDLSEITLEEADVKLTLKRDRSATEVITTQVVPNYAAPAAVPAAPVAAVSVADAAPVEATDDLHYLTAPLVGTYYESSSPDAEPFVKVGDVVSKGQTLCIIEAMKLMNEIESDVNGTVVEILVENAHGVDYGAKIYAIKPS